MVLHRLLAGRRRRGHRLDALLLLRFVVGHKLADHGGRGVGIQPDFTRMNFADALD
jgi:hypothetical protein